MALQARGRLALGSLQQQLLLGLVTAGGWPARTDSSQCCPTLLQSRLSLPAGKVDWDLVDEELERMPVEFKDARFDSLRHVLNILSAVDAEGAVEEVLPACILHSRRLPQHSVPLVQPSQRLEC